MLYFVGGGLWDEKDITLRGIDALRKCSAVYLDSYTSFWGGKDGLEKLVGKVTIATRKDLEDNAMKIVAQAKGSDVAIVVPGDPMVATTHSMIIMEARKHGVDTLVIHAPSIFSAIAETGLHIYKFGKTITVPFPSENFSPEGFYDGIKENRDRGLHTLLLLDIREQQMKPGYAMEIILSIAEKRNNEIKKGDKILVVSFKDISKISYGRIDALMKQEFPSPSCIIIPGKLHLTEEEFLS